MIGLGSDKKTRLNSQLCALRISLEEQLYFAIIAALLSSTENREGQFKTTMYHLNIEESIWTWDNLTSPFNPL